MDEEGDTNDKGYMSKDQANWTLDQIKPMITKDDIKLLRATYECTKTILCTSPNLASFLFKEGLGR